MKGNRRREEEPGDEGRTQEYYETQVDQDDGRCSPSECVCVCMKPYYLGKESGK